MVNQVRSWIDNLSCFCSGEKFSDTEIRNGALDERIEKLVSSANSSIYMVLMPNSRVLGVDTLAARMADTLELNVPINLMVGDFNISNGSYTQKNLDAYAANFRKKHDVFFSKFSTLSDDAKNNLSIYFLGLNLASECVIVDNNVVCSKGKDHLDTIFEHRPADAYSMIRDFHHIASRGFCFSADVPKYLRNN